MNDRERLEAWLDGRLSPTEQAQFQERLARTPELRTDLSLQRGIDTALRRGFRPPSSLGERLASLPTRSRPGVPRPLRRRLLVSAAAAVVVAAPLLLVLRGTQDSAHPVRELVNSDEDASGEPREAQLARVHEPDLRMLYRNVSEHSLTGETCAPSSEPQRTDLRQALASRYGEGFGMRPEAETLLDGPFVSTEWPSGMVLAGLPDGPDGPPAVLIAEHESEARCCLRLAAPTDGTLSVFTWQIGDILLTEVTPRAEPGLLQLFYGP